jgi:hypothetical protein
MMPVGQLLYVVVRFWMKFFEGLNNRGAAGVGG